MIAVVTVAREDGTFPEVGTLGRWIERGTPLAIGRRVEVASRVSCKPVRVEWHRNGLYSPVTEVEVVEFKVSSRTRHGRT